MPASLKQIEANRRNAKKSTGPKTPEGKAKVSQNAVKHGLYARKPVLNSPRLTENQAQYDALSTALSAEFAPKTTLEHFLIQRIANCVWQIQRADNSPASQFPNIFDGTSDFTDADLLTASRLHYNYLRFKRRLQHCAERTYAMLLSVNQTHFPTMVQQLEQTIISFQRRCETKPGTDAVSPIQRREAPWSGQMSGCETNPFLERVI